MPGRTDRRTRMVAVLLAFTVFGTLAMVRLGQYQVVEAPTLVAMAQESRVAPKPAFRPRGDILDREGAVLAQTATLDRLEAYPDQIPSHRHEDVVATLAEILGLSVEEARVRYLGKISKPDDPYEWLEREITAEQSAEIRVARDQGLLPGIGLAPRQVRVYPRTGGQGSASLASYLLGFVDADGHGMYGVERAYDDRLSGRATQAPAVASIAALDGSLDATVIPPLQLTIDARLQKQLERELLATMSRNRAKSVSAIIMDPNTGAILASAAVPGYDANDYASVASRGPDQLRDPTIMRMYEPGSVMKTFTVTAALDSGVVTPKTRITDQRALWLDGRRVRNADKGSMGVLTVKDVIANSRNVATSKMAMKLGPTQKAARVMYDTWKRVGVVGRTGVDLAAEEAGLAADPRRSAWARVDLANRSFGQGVAVTLMQLATGYATVVNGGFRVQPHVVADPAADDQPERVLSAKIARQVQDILVHVTGSVPHYAAGSLIKGYLIGGKTGTAQIWDVTKGDWKKRFNHSFVGFVGSDEPEVVIAVRIEEPHFRMDPYMNLEVESYELFRLIAMSAIKELDIKKSKDPAAGLPILGTAAARRLTPERAAQARASREERADRGRAKDKRRKDKPASAARQESSDRSAAEPDRGG